ncbi:hypothetical protein CAPTEDRAFT_213882 [Capitella teleta]|uniref:Protein aurora borealis n=1 Tax=Capitella teleta TaxID=283909 RepID=R7U1R8_CAPTE|nr:hypothetical protein CAPTEDRAFT_213882 [Capitella teleta]|eukprot:ELT97130.1 hypothetical protein CAPTEDRAFT_213882 [Capitella teleta]
MVNDHMPEDVMDALQKVLTNFSPAKPTRKLKGADRQTLLQSPPTPEASPETCNYYNNTYAECPTNSVPPTEPNSLSWDYGDVIIGSVARRPQRHERLSNQIFRKSFPPPGEARPKTLDLGQEDWLGMAPLASPETLSETSSMDSFGSKRFSAGYQKLTSSVPRLASIKQSPLRPTRSDGFATYAEKQSPKHSLSLTPIACEPLRQSPERVTVSPGSPMAKSTPFDIIKKESPPICEKPDEASVAVDLFAAGKDNNTEDLGCTPLPEGDEHDLTDLSVVQDRIQSKVDGIQAKDPYRLAFAHDVSSERSDDFSSHSPDSLVEIPCKPLPYHSVNGHYSSGGRGYPHGGYMYEEEAAPVLCGDRESLVEEDDLCTPVPPPLNGVDVELAAPKVNGSVVPVCVVDAASDSASSSSDDDGDDVDYEMMSDTPIQIMTNEAYL